MISCLFSVILRSVQLAVYTYSFAAHALSNEKNFTKSRFCVFSVILCFEQLEVNTYSIAVHALSDEKNTEKSRFCAFSAKLRFVRFAVIHTASFYTPCLTKKISRNQDFVPISVILCFVQLEVNTYSFAAHASSDEKNTEKSRFCALFVILLFCTDSKYITYSILNNSLR